MSTLIPFVFTQFFDNNGDPLNGGKVYTYEAGTTTPKATYTTSSGLVENANPVILDSAGRAQIWLGDGGYKFILKTSADVTVGSTFDNVGGASDTAFGGNTQEISINTAVDETLANSAFIATAALTLSLLDVATAGEGFYFSISAFGGDVTIDPDTTETINNASTLTIVQGASAIIMCDGDEWWTMCYTGGIVAGQLASNSVSTVKIQDDAVTLAKLDGDAGFANKLIGYDGSGDPVNITEGDGIDVSSSVIKLAAGTLVDRAYTTYTANSDITALIPYDDTIPQVGEGTEILSVSITPKTTTNRIRIRFQGFCGGNASVGTMSCALFINGAANAVQVSSTFNSTTDQPMNLVMEHEYVPGSTSAQTISVRVGPNGGTMRMNGTSGARRFGGAASATLVLEEIIA